MFYLLSEQYLLIINLQPMSQKTQMSELSTNVDSKPTSILTSKRREMYKLLKKNQQPPKTTPLYQLSNDQIPHDLLHFQPNLITNLSFPLFYFLQNDIKVCVKDNFYEISGLRGKKKFFSRHSQYESQLIYFYAEKLTKNINMISVERYLNHHKEGSQKIEELYYHVNLAKYQPQTQQVYNQNYYMSGEEVVEEKSKSRLIYDFQYCKLIENSKKGVLFFKIMTKDAQISASKYKIMLIDLQQRKKLSKKGQKLKIMASIDFDTSHFGRQNEQIIKIIKSQFGDIILIITNREIYELQIEDYNDGYKMYMKPYKLQKIINKKDIQFTKKPSQNLQQKSSKVFYGDENRQELIVDAQYLSNGLKIVILTNLNQLIVIDSHNHLFSQKIEKMLANVLISDKYLFNEFSYTKLYSSNGNICLEFKTSKGNDLMLSSQTSSANNLDKKNTSTSLTIGFLLLKMQSNSFSLNKIVGYPFQYKQIIYHNVSQCAGLDQIYIQYIEKCDLFRLNMIKCKLLVSEINAFVRIGDEHYNYSKNYCSSKRLNGVELTHFHPKEEQKEYSLCTKSDSSRFVYFLNGKELTCYKIFDEVVIQKYDKQQNKLFNYTFFQKPIKISVSPLTMHFIIVFKEFVKFFYFSYTSLKNYFTLKIKNVNDAQYVLNGSKILIATSQGDISLINAYTFQEEKILEYHGQILDIKMADQNHLLIRSNKNFLSLYQRKEKDESNNYVDSNDQIPQSTFSFVKKYQVKIEDGDKYQFDHEKILIVRNNFQIEMYLHVPMSIPSGLTQAEKEVYYSLAGQHRHLANKKDGINNIIGNIHDEYPINVLISKELGFLFVTTNKSNIREYIWPLSEPLNSSEPQVFIQKVTTQKILSIFVDARFNNLYVVSNNGTITQLAINQYINSQLTPFVYIFNQKTINDQKQKREYSDKGYFIDNFTPTELNLNQSHQQDVDQHHFLIDKLKDDIDEMIKISSNKGKQESSKVKEQIKGKQLDLNKQISDKKKQYLEKIKVYQLQSQKIQKQYTNEKKKQQQNYQKQLLKIYKESSRLKQILKSQDQKLTSEKHVFVESFNKKLIELNKEKQIQVVRLENEYKEIQQRKLKIQKQNAEEEIQQEIQMQEYKKVIHELIEKQHIFEEQTKEKFLGENSKKEKAINNLKHRNSYFQNLILETKLQISQLLKDQVQYDNKKSYLKEELKDKEQLIEKIEKQLVIYLKNTEDMKTIKNNHEFQLDEYQKQVNPIQDNYKHLEENVKNMNLQIMLEYNHKVTKLDSIEENLLLIKNLKEKKKTITNRKLQKQNQYLRIVQSITNIAQNVYNVDLKHSLMGLFDNNQRSQELMRLDEEKQEYRRAGQKLMRHKNMIRKEIQEEEKKEEHILKNQHEFYRYHNENTTLVREFNDLKKRQKNLAQEQSKLQQKLSLLKKPTLTTPLQRIPSRSLNTHGTAEKKLTPFQRYQEMNTINTKNNQDTTDTRVSKNSQSLSFLKGLLKEVNHTDNKYEKLELMKQRVRTFVNPEFKARPQEIKKMLFSRGRGTSQFLKLK